jgi:Ca2+-binding EF-hand superfamily protein
MRTGDCRPGGIDVGSTCYRLVPRERGDGRREDARTMQLLKVAMWRGSAALLGFVIFGAWNAPPAEARLLQAIVAEEDADGDGKLVRDEAPVEILFYFDMADADGNGAIDEFEARSWDASRLSGKRPQREGGAARPVAKKGDGTVKSMIQQLDRTGDGQLSREELPRKYRDAFEKLDLDGDGFLELEEATTLDDRVRKLTGSGRSPRR